MAFERERESHQWKKIDCLKSNNKIFKSQLQTKYLNLDKNIPTDYDKCLYDGCTLNQEELKNNLLTVAHL